MHRNEQKVIDLARKMGGTDVSDNPLDLEYAFKTEAACRLFAAGAMALGFAVTTHIEDGYYQVAVHVGA